MTPATAYLSKRQRRFPLPAEAPDRARRLYQYLAPGLPANLSALVSSGVVAIGELRRNTPDVQTVPVGDSAVIELTTGMMDFIHAVVRSLAGNMVKVTSEGPRNKPALSLVDVGQRTAALFREWKWPNRWIWAVRRIASPQFPISQSVHGTMDTIASLAETFLLSHELGHVALHRGLMARSSDNEELAADSIGLKLLLAAGPAHREDPTVMFAAAILAVRIFAGLEGVGVDFPRTVYPPQSERVANLRATMLAESPSLQYFHEIARIAVAYQDQMDDVEKHLDKHRRVSRDAGPRDPERLLVRLIAELLDVAQQRYSVQRLTADVVALAEHTPPNILQQAVRTLREYYVESPRTETFIDEHTKAVMGRALGELMAGLPAPVAKLLSAQHTSGLDASPGGAAFAAPDAKLT